MLLSGIGRSYDPETRQGTVGRNYAYQTYSHIQLYFDDKNFNPFISAGALGQSADDFNGDNFDHAGLNFVGGAGITCQPTNGRPLANLPVPPGTPRWGAQWKEQVKKNYLRSFGFASQGSSHSAYANYLDLDPTYTDRFGRPLLRMTFDFPENDARMSNYITDNREGDESASVCRQPRRNTLQRDSGSEYAQHRRRDHGHRSDSKRS
jgi:gluconate 2-dehydrogenase alpha chain